MPSWVSCIALNSFYFSLSEIRYMSPVNLTGIFFFWEKCLWSWASTYLSHLLLERSLCLWAAETRELELGNPRHCLHLPPLIPTATCCMWPTEISTPFYHLGVQKNSKVTLNKGGRKNNIQIPCFFYKGKVLTDPFVFSPSLHSELLLVFLNYFTKVLQRFSSLKSWCD